jgi:hypothetical protein
MMRNRLLIRVLQGLWGGSAVLALAAMLLLWWGRERALYLGHSPDQQRQVLVERAGLDPATLDAARQVAVQVNATGAYSPGQDLVKKSYATYLLLPRRMEDSAEIGLETSPLDASTSGPSSDTGFHTVTPTPRGLLISVVVVTGLALLLGATVFRTLDTTFPERMACAAGVTFVFVVGSKGVTGELMWGGIGIIFLGMTGIAAGLLHSRHSMAATRRKAADYLRTHSMETVCLILTLLFLLWSFLMAVSVVPDDWDSWAQWAPKAKILALAEADLTQVSFFVPGSADYPLLWPSVWAFSGWLSGGWEEQWSKGWSVIFLALTVWQLGALSIRFRPFHDTARLWWPALFVTMPAIPLIASWAYAESALWLMLVCASGRLFVWQRTRLVRDLMLAGLFTGLATATKNEGFAFSLLAGCWVLFTGKHVKQTCIFMLPALMMFGCWRAVVGSFGSFDSHVFQSGGGPGYFFANVPELLAGFSFSLLHNWFSFRQWLFVLPVLTLLALLLWVRQTGGHRLSYLLPFGYLGLLSLVILFYGPEWQWQMSVAWNRLSAQFLAVLFPALIVINPGNEQA